MTHLTLGFVVAAFLMALLFTPLAISMARRLSIYDVPEPGKIHAVDTPRGAGLGFSAVWLVLASTLFFSDRLGQTNATLTAGLLVGAMLVLVLGLFDDFKEMSSGVKFAAQFAAAAIFLVLAQPAFANNLIFSGIAIFWIVAVTNAFNLIDGLDGLAAGLATVSALSFALLGYALSQPTLVALSLLLAAACLGFIPYNWHPARAFMGDAGSLFLGFVLATLAVGLFDKSAVNPALASAFFLAVPLFDTFLSVLRRAVHQKPLFKPDRSHFYNLLMNRGFTHEGSVFFSLSLAAVLSAFGFGFLFAESRIMVVAVGAAFITVLVAVTIKYRLLAMD